MWGDSRLVVRKNVADRLFKNGEDLSKGEESISTILEMVTKGEESIFTILEMVTKDEESISTILEMGTKGEESISTIRKMVTKGVVTGVEEGSVFQTDNSFKTPNRAIC